MIIDLPKFLAAERPVWDELEIFLNRLEADPHRALPLEQARRLHYLYERTAADLAKLNTFASEPDTRSFLESLVARAYGELHETRERPHRLRPLRWFMVEFPQAFRRHLGVFWLTVAITLAGCAFGVFATLLDPESRHVTMAFGHDQQTPSQRVAKEERAKHDRLEATNPVIRDFSAAPELVFLDRYFFLPPALLALALFLWGGLPWRQARVEVEDDGRAFNPLDLPPVDTTVPLEQRPVGGLGVHMIRQLMDSVEYRRADGRNILTLTRRAVSLAG